MFIRTSLPTEQNSLILSKYGIKVDHHVKYESQSCLLAPVNESKQAWQLDASAGVQASGQTPSGSQAHYLLRYALFTDVCLRLAQPLRSNRIVRRRSVLGRTAAKWKCHWLIKSRSDGPLGSDRVHVRVHVRWQSLKATAAGTEGNPHDVRHERAEMTGSRSPCCTEPVSKQHWSCSVTLLFSVQRTLGLSVSFPARVHNTHCFRSHEVGRLWLNKQLANVWGRCWRSPVLLIYSIYSISALHAHIQTGLGSNEIYALL